MSDLLMDPDTNDLVITNGDLSLADGTTAIAQDWQQRLQTWLGEWFLDTSVGVPYKQQILVKNPNFDLIQADLINQTIAVPGIQEVIDFTFNFDSAGRSLSVSISAQDSNGQTITAQASVGVPVDATIEGTPY